MKHIKAGTEAIARVKMEGEVKTVRIKATESPKRIKAEATTQAEVERVKLSTQRVYNGGFVKDDKTGMLYRDGEFYRIMDGCPFKCWPDGMVKDQKTDTHTCWFGRISKKPTEEDLLIASKNIMKCMIKSFPELFYNLETGERENKMTDHEGNMRFKHTIV